LIDHLLENDYAVATFDLPGHGLSEGARCEIDDFSQYALALRDFQQTVNPYIEGPRHFLGHSTGASAILQLMSEGGGNDFERIILAAPLIRCTQWDKSKLGYTYNIPFIESVPRIFRENSSDPDYLEFIKNHDPLQFRYVPLSWVKALHQWNENIEQMHIDKRSIEIIQGDSDKIVDWKYNMNFLDEKFPFAQLNIIEGANHDLLNESPALREEVFNLVTASETADCLCCCR
jgi:alpha-beta hydrolase superfamily lysophospholipase